MPEPFGKQWRLRLADLVRFGLTTDREQNEKRTTIGTPPLDGYPESVNNTKTTDRKQNEKRTTICTFLGGHPQSAKQCQDN
jgi:hypothetical protein